MTAALLERDPHFAGQFPHKGTLPAKAGTLYLRGWLVCADAAGRAAPPGPGLRAQGVSIGTFDNSEGSDDAMAVEIAYGVHAFACEGALPKPSDVVFAVDNATVSLSAGVGADRGVAGVVSEVRAGLVYVWINPVISGALAARLAA